MSRNYIWELSLKGVVKLPTIAPTLFMIVWWRRHMESKVIINADQWMFLSVRLIPTTKIIVSWYLSKKNHEFHRGSRNLFGAPRCSETLRRGHFWYIRLLGFIQISPNTKRNSLSNPIAWSSMVIGFIWTKSHTSCSFHINMSASHSIKRYNWMTLFLLSFHSYLFPMKSFWTFTLPSPFHPSWKIQEIWVSQWHCTWTIP